MANNKKLEDLKRQGGEAELTMVSMHTNNEQDPDELREERGRAHGRRGSKIDPDAMEQRLRLQKHELTTTTQQV